MSAYGKPWIKIGKVELYFSPWVTGSRALDYPGPISIESFTEDEELATIDKILTEDLIPRLAELAEESDANAVVGVEIHVDPFYELDGKKGLWVRIVGTAARLAPYA